MNVCQRCGFAHAQPRMTLARVQRAACPPNPHRKCKGCGESFPANTKHFNRTGKAGGLGTRCKVCERARDRAIYKAEQAKRSRLVKPAKPQRLLPIPCNPYRTAWRNQANAYPA